MKSPSIGSDVGEGKCHRGASLTAQGDGDVAGKAVLWEKLSAKSPAGQSEGDMTSRR